MKHKKILIIAAHQDDETIGCGASIRKWADAGATISVLFMTDGATGFAQGTSGKDIVDTRMKEAKEACSHLRVTRVSTLGIACQQVTNDQATFHRVIETIRYIRPNLIITHTSTCKHRDHKATAEIVLEATWKAQEDILEDLGPVHHVKELWGFEILDLLPDVDFVVDVTDVYDSKIAAMQQYGSQEAIVGETSRTLMCRSRVRGNLVGVEHAEVFTNLMPTLR